MLWIGYLLLTFAGQKDLWVGTSLVYVTIMLVRCIEEPASHRAELVKLPEKVKEVLELCVKLPGAS